MAYRINRKLPHHETCVCSTLGAVRWKGEGGGMSNSNMARKWRKFLWYDGPYCNLITLSLEKNLILFEKAFYVRQSKVRRSSVIGQLVVWRKRSYRTIPVYRWISQMTNQSKSVDKMADFETLTVCVYLNLCMFTIYSLYVHHYTHHIHIHCMFIICSLYTHYIFTVCSLDIHYILTIDEFHRWQIRQKV